MPRKRPGSIDEPGLLEQLAPEPVERVLVLLEVAAGDVPEPTVGLDGPPAEQNPALAVLDERAHARRRVGVADEAARGALDPSRGGGAVELGCAAGTEPPGVEDRHLGATVPGVSPRHVPASVTELQRVGLFGSLPGETIARLAERMEREEVPGGHGDRRPRATTDRFYVLLSGLAGVTQAGRGARAVIRPGETFGEVAPLMGMERTATVTAMTPCVVASCDRETFDELLRPLFVDDASEPAI